MKFQDKFYDIIHHSKCPSSALYSTVQVMAWSGDQFVDWSRSDGLPSSIVSALSLAASGMGLVHSDIGGYTGAGLVLVRSKELLLRWAEYAAFTPIMRTHEVNTRHFFME